MLYMSFLSFSCIFFPHVYVYPSLLYFTLLCNGLLSWDMVGLVG
jgi:hypothetical protein